MPENPRLIPAGNPSLWTGVTGTNTYFIDGPTTVLVDAGVGSPEHLDALQAALGGRPLDLVLITHSHSDHASGVPALLERWPSAAIRPSSSSPLNDGDALPAGAGTLTALYTPGHAPDHFCFVDEAKREAYCGDLLRLGATIVIPGSRGGDLRAYLASLRRIRELRLRRLLPGHGPAIEDPEALIAQYLAHREARDAQIVDALRRGFATPADIALDVYGKLPSELTAAAAESVLAHLQKLMFEGAAELVDGRWRLT